MDYYQMTAPCGLDCFNCPAHLALENQEMRAHISQLFGIPIEKAVCKGCRPEGGTCLEILGQRASCAVYTCTQEKGMGFCSDCGDFPCDSLQPYADMASQVPHNTKVFNLCLIKKMGLEAWAKDKAKKVRDTYYSGKFTL